MLHRQMHCSTTWQAYKQKATQCTVCTAIQYNTLIYKFNCVVYISEISCWNLLVGLSRYEGSKPGDGSVSSPVSVDPLPLVEHARVSVTSSSSSCSDPEPNSTEQATWKRPVYYSSLVCVDVYEPELHSYMYSTLTTLSFESDVIERGVCTCSELPCLLTTVYIHSFRQFL